MTPLSTNVLIGTLNFAAAIVSIPIIGAGIWLSTQPSSCLNFLQWPLIILGTLILIVSLTGSISSFKRNSWCLVFYLFAMPLFVVILVFVVMFAYAVTVRGSGHVVRDRGYLEYDLNDFSVWLRWRIGEWNGIQRCLKLGKSKMCDDLDQVYRLPQDFFNARITPLQSGCCKPATACGYTFVNPSYWINATNLLASDDCLRWSNNQTELCFMCASCKAGFLATVKGDWRKSNVVVTVALVGLIVVYASVCYLLMRDRIQELLTRYVMRVYSNV